MPAFAAKLKTALCTFKTIKFVKVESVPLTLTHYGVMIFVVVYVLTFQVLSLSTTSGCNGGASERASEQASASTEEKTPARARQITIAVRQGLHRHFSPPHLSPSPPLSTQHHHI